MNSEHADFGLCDFEMVYTDTGRRVYHSNAEKIKKVLRTHGSFGCGAPLLRRQLADKIKWKTKLKRNQDVAYFQKAALLAKTISSEDHTSEPQSLLPIPYAYFSFKQKKN